jgi:nicotinamide-nucleotide amidase
MADLLFSVMSQPAVELLTIGTELLLGFTVDTNGAFLGQVLSAAGTRIVRRTSVGDRAEEIRAAVDEALSRTGFVITTGGLGPTRDDLSKQVIADVLGMPLEFDEEVWAWVLARYRRFGRAPVESNRSQAMVPRGGTALHNQWGTAPGLWLESARGLVVMLPGVPLEMRMLMEHEVLPRLVARGGSTTIASAVLRTSGIPESTLAERIGSLEDALAPLTLAYLPSVAGVDLRLTAWNQPTDRAREQLADGIARLRGVAHPWAYGEAGADLAGVVLEQVRSRGSKLAIAESCTGGVLGGRITDIAGASDVFVGGIVAYDNRVKRDLLGVPAAMIAEHGAVSAAVAQAMAVGAASRLDASVAVSVTGIAGPAGGSEEKPVGTVWFGFSVDGKTDTHKSVFGGTRTEIRERAAQGALWGLWQRLGGGGEI